MSAADRADDLLTFITERTVTPRPDCMIWANACDRGYGRIYLDGKAKRVHRVIWELKHGPIPEDLTVDHLCRVRNCVNTEHMELVTQAENFERALAFRPSTTKKDRRRRVGGKRRRTHCKNGHEFTPETTVRNAAGARICVICFPVVDPAAESCKRGHPWAVNAVIRDGRRRCKRCLADWMRDYYHRKRAA